MGAPLHAEGGREWGQRKPIMGARGPGGLWEFNPVIQGGCGETHHMGRREKMGPGYNGLSYRPLNVMHFLQTIPMEVSYGHQTRACNGLTYNKH
jgi:hypothetical protein